MARNPGRNARPPKPKTDIAAQVDALVAARMDEIVARVAHMMDVKLAKVYDEISRIQDLVKPNPIPELELLSVSELPSDCCPLPRHVTVKQFLSMTPVQKNYPLMAQTNMIYYLERFKGKSLTADVLARAINFELPSQFLMLHLDNHFKHCASDQLRFAAIHDSFRVYAVYGCEKSFEEKEEIANGDLASLAELVGLEKVVLKSRDPAALDADFEVRRQLLVSYPMLRYHVFDYLEHLQSALLHSNISSTLKCRRLNNLLPPPWVDWCAEYESANFDTIHACLEDPMPEDIESRAQIAVRYVFDKLGTFINYKHNAKINDAYFSTRSWAPLRTSREHANLIWQVSSDAKSSSTLTRCTKEDLATPGFLTEDQMEHLYQNKSKKMKGKTMYELYALCPSYLAWMKQRLHRETDMEKLAGNDPLMRSMGREGVLFSLDIAMEAAAMTPYTPDDTTFGRLSEVLKEVGLEWVDDEM